MFFTQFKGVIQAEMNQRGGPPFLHVAFETHQHARRAKRTINNSLRDAMAQYGGEDKSLRATWARSPPASAPHRMRENSWTTWQLHSFDAHKDHLPHIAPPTFPDTWAQWYRDNYRQHSTVAWRYDSTACPDDVYREYIRMLQGNTDPELDCPPGTPPDQETGTSTRNTEQNLWSTAS